MRGTVWIVATPLGNLGDLSPRARETLERVGVVLSEDTRRTGQLLQLAGISGKRLLSLHEHNEEERLGEVLDLLAAGTDAAVVSDAGTPLIADPGYRLVAAYRKRGLYGVAVSLASSLPLPSHWPRPSRGGRGRASGRRGPATRKGG